MKKVLTLLSIFIATEKINAQISIIPEIGMTRSNMEYKSTEGNDLQTKHKKGLTFGVAVRCDVYKGIFIQSGLSYLYAGAKLSETQSYLGTTSGFNSDVKLNYLQLPVNIGYMYHLGKFGNVFAIAGPYLGYALSGTSVDQTFLNGVTAPVDKSAITFGSTAADNMKRLDFGMGFGVGYQTTGASTIRLQYGLALKDLSNETSKTIKNNYISLSVGYAIKFKKKQ